jgi:bifunctional NMN adenylyltransferase/nudix hydrolase|nr:MAG TPA: bifunctional nicotinamide mononucleotide adenylyltransferase/ADP-ribose pyrophosphatase [Caudoviricetes sp.]
MSECKGVGVIVGRFQVAELTEGHKEIFEYVLSKNHNQNIVILGVAPTKATKNNPLDFDSRRRMIEETYPGKFTIMYVKDHPSDEVWSKNIDALVDDIAGRRPVTFYGSRDSFIIYYHGKHNCEEYQQRLYCSGTVERDADGKTVQSSREWRSGCIYATQNRYPTVYPTVDVAIFDGEPGNPYKYIYLGRKANEQGLRFIGGFADVTDESFVQTANREAREETGMEVEFIGWIGSAKIDDWRYRSEEDKIITNFFAFRRVFGGAKAQDDIVSIERIQTGLVTREMIAECHRPLYLLLKEWLKRNDK